MCGSSTTRVPLAALFELAGLYGKYGFVMGERAPGSIFDNNGSAGIFCFSSLGVNVEVVDLDCGGGGKCTVMRLGDVFADEGDTDW